MAVFQCRSLDARDLDLAAALHRAAFTALGERGWTRRDMAELLASPGVTGTVLLHAGREVGFALCRVAADEAELLTIAVDAGHRRRGAGRALLDLVIGTAATSGAATLFLEVAADNPAACSLYEQKHFRTVGRRKDYYQRKAGATADALIMRLALKPGE
jgi:ribosomal-protein-alanine N-acetyltransferase